MSKYALHAMVGFSSVGLAIALPTIMSQQKKIMDLHKQTSKILDDHQKYKSAHPTAEDLYSAPKSSPNTSNKESQPTTSKEGQSGKTHIAAEESHEQSKHPSKHAINNAVKSSYNKQKESNKPHVQKQEESTEAPRQDKIGKKNDRNDRSNKKKQKIKDLKDRLKDKGLIPGDKPSGTTSSQPASNPTQTSYPHLPAAQQANSQSNNGPSYDSTMYLPVAMNSSSSSSASPATAAAASAASGDTSTPVTTTPTTTTSTTSSTTESTLDEILSTLQFDIPAQGGGLINNTSTNTTRSLPKTRAENTNLEYWTQPFIISNDDPTFDHISVVRFQENIFYQPEDSSISGSEENAAIIIRKDDTTIDLYGFTLALDSSEIGGLSATTVVHGIYIEPGVKNTKIISSAPHQTKGYITGFTGFGIFAEGTDSQTSDSCDIYTNKIKQVEINNLFIAENFNGISLNNVFQARINQSNVISNVSQTDSYGIYCSNSHDITINECKVNKNYSYQNMYGIYVKDCVGTSISNSEANFNESIQTGNTSGITITGSSASTCHANSIFNCQANANLSAYVSGVESIGIHLSDETFNNVIEQCSTFSNSYETASGASTPSTLPIGYGIKLDNSNHNQVHKNTSGNHLNYGFYDSLTGSTTIYTGNKALYNPTENYSISFTTGTGATQPISTTIVYPGDLSARGTVSPLDNIEIEQSLS